MRRDEALTVIRMHWSELQEKGIATLSLLGSLARDEAGPDDEVEILVELSRPLGFAFFGIQEDLAELLGRPVVLVTPDSFRAEERDQVLRDAVRAA